VVSENETPNNPLATSTPASKPAVRPGESLNPYDLAPAPAPAPQVLTPVQHQEPGKAVIHADKLLDAFDDDTDFSDDANPSTRLEVPPSESEFVAAPPGVRPEPFVLSGRGEAVIIAAVGAGVTVAAMVAAAVVASQGKHAWFPAAIATLFNIGLHTLTGLVALGVGAHLAGRPLGSVALGLSRMLLAVAAFALLISVNIPIPGRFDEALLGLGAYAGVLMITGRRSPKEWGPVFAAHGLLAAATWAAFALNAWVSAAAAVKAVA